MRVTALLGILLASSILAGGCSAARTLEGTWASDGQVPMTMTVTGGDYKNTMNIMGATVTLTGKATYDDKAGILKVAEIQLEAPGVPEMMVAAAKNRLPKEMDINVSWKNQDEIVLASAGGAETTVSGTYKRQKQ